MQVGNVGMGQLARPTHARPREGLRIIQPAGKRKNEPHCTERFQLRKSKDLCRCGCRGWCSQFAMQNYLRWSLEHVAKGIYPDRRHDGSEFAADSYYAALAGSRLGREECSKGAVALIKLDLKELCTTFGLPAVTSIRGACPWCFLEGYKYDIGLHASPIDGPLSSKTFEDWDRACRACEIIVTLSWDQWTQVRSELRPDRRRDGARGLALRSNVSFLGVNLLKNDRLEPSAALPDTHACFLWTADSYPSVPLTFWRRSKETHARRRSPLIAKHLGTTFSSAFCVDWLHTLSKGVFAFCLGEYYNSVFWANLFRVPHADWDTIVAMSVHRIQHMLKAWYRDQEKHGRNPTRIERLVSGMFNKKEVTLHASETNHFMVFTHDVIHPQLRHEMDSAEVWDRALGSLMKIYGIISQNGYHNCKNHDIQNFWDAAVIHIRACRELGVELRPKHHMLLEMASRRSPQNVFFFPPFF